MSIFRLKAATAVCGMLLASAPPAAANNYGESLAWQFMTPNELAAQAALRDMIERRRGGGYAAPDYVTNIARQYNCSIAATATGNASSQSAIANSPAVTGASATATGNQNSTSAGSGHGSSGVSTGQSNAGPVSSWVTGGTQTTVTGSPSQALNSTQSNSGNQAASVTHASACAFGMLN